MRYLSLPVTGARVKLLAVCLSIHLIVPPPPTDGSEKRRSSAKPDSRASADYASKAASTRMAEALAEERSLSASPRSGAV